MANTNDSSEAIKSPAPAPEVTPVTPSTPQVEASGSATQAKAQTAQPEAQGFSDSNIAQISTPTRSIESEENIAYVRGYNGKRESLIDEECRS